MEMLRYAAIQKYTGGGGKYQNGLSEESGSSEKY